MTKLDPAAKPAGPDELADSARYAAAKVSHLLNAVQNRICHLVRERAIPADAGTRLCAMVEEARRLGYSAIIDWLDALGYPEGAYCDGRRVTSAITVKILPSDEHPIALPDEQGPLFTDLPPIGYFEYVWHPDAAHETNRTRELTPDELPAELYGVNDAGDAVTVRGIGDNRVFVVLPGRISSHHGPPIIKGPLFPGESLIDLSSRDYGCCQPRIRRNPGGSRGSRTGRGGA